MDKETQKIPMSKTPIITYEEISKKVDQLVIIPDIREKSYGYYKFTITDGIMQNNLCGGMFTCTAVGASYLVLFDRIKDDSTGKPKLYTTMMITKQLRAETWSHLSKQIDTAIKEFQAIDN